MMSALPVSLALTASLNLLVCRRVALLLVRRLLLIRGEDRLGDGQSARPQVRCICAV